MPTLGETVIIDELSLDRADCSTVVDIYYFYNLILAGIGHCTVRVETKAEKDGESFRPGATNKATNQRLTRAGAVKGTVKVAGGLGIPQAKVELDTAGGQVAATGETDSDGKYCFGGLAGEGNYTVLVSAQGYRPGVSRAAGRRRQ